MSYDVQKILQEEGLDPVRGLLEIAFGEFVEPSVKRQALKDILDRVSPTLKSIETTADKKLEKEMADLKDKIEELVELYKKDY